MYRRSDPKMTTEALTQALLATYDYEPIFHTLINKKRGTVIHLRSGGVISTPFRNMTAQMLTYIMTHRIHPKDDDPALYADRMRKIKRNLPDALPKQPRTIKPPKPKQLTLADKLERLRTAMLLQDKRIEALEIQLRGNVDE